MTNGRRVPWSDTIIYEAHVKGLTKLLLDLGEDERGTYAALGNRSGHRPLRRLGVTAIELLPVHAFLQDRMLLEKICATTGATTRFVFRAEAVTLSGDPATELRTAIRRLHAAGLEVILDVVYNHTCEGSELVRRCRGAASTTRATIVSSTTNARTHQRHRHRQHVEPHTSARRADGDGFTALFRRVVSCRRVPLRPRRHARARAARFDPGSGFFDAFRQDPALQAVKMISEPWDIGPGGYQLGNHPPGFSEWNDRYRDTRAAATGAAIRINDRDRAAALRLLGPVRSRGAGPSRRSTTSRAMTARRWPTSRCTKASTTRPTAKTIGTADRTTVANWGVEGRRRRSGHQERSASACNARC